MSIQKKSLLNTLKTTKKAIVASTPTKAEVTPSTRLAAKDTPLRYADKVGRLASKKGAAMFASKGGVI